MDVTMQSFFHVPSHGTLLTIAILLAIALLFLLITSKKNEPQKSNDAQLKKNSITSQDIRAIAGDDIMTTQLDLGRAYIEMGKKQLAKKILTHVFENGTDLHKLEADRLLKTI